VHYKVPKAFHAIESGGAWNLEIVAGDKATVHVTGDDNIVPLLSTTVKDGRLVIRASESDIHPKVPVLVRVALPALTAVDLSGAGNASVVDVTAKRLALDVSGAGSLSFKGRADDVLVKTSGAGNVALAGNGKSLSAVASGSGNIDASAFEVPLATIKATGAGHVAVNATTSLDVQVSGAAHVVYSGAPKLATKVSGAGSVTAKDADAPQKKARGGW
jgi:hypothetical protein